MQGQPFASMSFPVHCSLSSSYSPVHIDLLTAALNKLQVDKNSFSLIFNFIFNPLNAELNPVCHLLALVGAHHILHVRVNHFFMLINFYFSQNFYCCISCFRV